jgi:hypothetical protein
MKIAIYGDSYANGFIDESINDDLSWVQILYRKYKDSYSFSNFGHRGSSLYYSYTKFFETHSDFDKIVFFVTFPSRIYLTSPLIDNDHKRHINGVDTAARLVETYPIGSSRMVFKAAYDYYLHIHNPEEHALYYKLMLAELKRHRSGDCLFISNETIVSNDDLNFYQVSPTEAASKYYDVRHCHMSAEKHIVLAEEIDKFLKQEIAEINYTALGAATPSKEFNKYFLPMHRNTARQASFDQHMSLVK